MKKMFFMSVLLIIFSAVIIFAGGGGQQGSSNVTWTPSKAGGGRLVDTPVNLTIMNGYNPITPPYAEVEFWKRYEKRTNVIVKWISVVDAEVAAKRNLAIASGDLPDAFYRCGFQNIDLLTYGLDGIFQKLTSLIPTYAPNLKKMLDEDRTVAKGITQVDGNIYGLPFMSDFQSNRYGRKIFYNKVWLSAVNRTEPDTMNQFVDLLREYRKVNPGKKDQCIPLDATDIEGLIQTFYGLFGLYNRGSATNRVDVDPKTNTLRYIQSTGEYRKMMEWLHTLYSEKLVNPDIFTTTERQMNANIQNEITGVFCFINPVPAGPFGVNYVGGGVLTGIDGTKFVNGFGSKLGVPGAFVVTNVNKHPELSVAWADYTYSTEGILEFWMGWEGETFTIVNGVYTYVPFITNNPSGLTLDQVVSTFVPWPGGGQPTLQTEKYSKGGASLPEAMSATRKAAPYFPKEVWTPFTYTANESERLITLQTDLNTCINEARADFITNGVTDISWNKYLNDLKSIGQEEFMKIQNAAYQRYIK